MGGSSCAVRRLIDPVPLKIDQYLSEKDKKKEKHGGQFNGFGHRQMLQIKNIIYTYYKKGTENYKNYICLF